MFTVKLTRKEYREEFLKSNEWRLFRANFLQKYPNCYKCGLSATDLHHIFYPKDIYSLNSELILQVCRNCHDLLHTAIELRLLPDPTHTKTDFRKAKDLTKRISLNYIINKKKILSENTIITNEIYQEIMNASLVAQQYIRGILKISYLSQCEGIKISNKKLKKIQFIITKFNNINNKLIQNKTKKVFRMTRWKTLRKNRFV